MLDCGMRRPTRRFCRRCGYLLFGGEAWLIVGDLAKSSQPDVLQFAVLPSVGDHLVRVRADKGAFHAVKVGRFVVGTCWIEIMTFIC